MARQRKEAPLVEVRDHSESDERGQIVRLYAPECLDNYERRNVQRGRVIERSRKPSNEFHAYFSDPAVPDSYYLRRGYEAVKDEKGEHVTHKGDKLWRIKTAVVQKDFDRAAREGAELLQNAQVVDEEAAETVEAEA